MSFYRVRNPDKVPIWVAFEDDEMRIWSYVHNTGMFHLNPGLFQDFYFEHKNSYEPIDLAAARTAVRDGLGTLTPLAHGVLVRRLSDKSAARSVADLFAHAQLDTQVDGAPGLDPGTEP